MFCPKCGTQNADDSNHCYNCGAVLNQTPNNENRESPNYSQSNYSNNSYTQQPYGNEPYRDQYNYQSSNAPRVENHLIWSILVTIFCCLPLGIPAIIFAAQVDDKLRKGDYEGAVESANKAKTFCWIAFGLGIGLIILWFLILILGASKY